MKLINRPKIDQEDQYTPQCNGNDGCDLNCGCETQCLLSCYYI